MFAKEPATPPYREKGSTCLVKRATDGIYLFQFRSCFKKLNNSSKEHAFRSSGNAAIAIQHIENYMSNNIAE